MTIKIGINGMGRIGRMVVRSIVESKNINSNFNKTKGIKKILIKKTIDLGLKKIKKNKIGFIDNIFNKILDVLVRKKIKKQFGGSLKTFVSGGGALNVDIGLFLNSIGLPTLQGYGLTETSPVVSCNPINDIRVETVGPPFNENQVKIAEDGEILVKGENVMLGYWNNDIETKKILVDGWLHTGDIGKFKTVSQSSIAAGVRRVEALRDKQLEDFIKNKEKLSTLSTQKDEETIKELSSQIIKLGGKPKVDNKDLKEIIKNLSRQLEQLNVSSVLQDKTKNIIKDDKINNIKVRFQKVQDLPPKDLRKLVDNGKNELGDGIVIVFASREGKVGLAVGLTENLLKNMML